VIRDIGETRLHLPVLVVLVGWGGVGGVEHFCQ
jgi:hypothetical protein